MLAHKLREALRAELEDRTLSGDVEVDGAYFGGYVKPENRKEDRQDRRLKQHQTDKRRANHSINFKDEDACTNQVESFFSRLRRAEIGTHHKISGRYLHQYATEMMA